MKGKHISPLEWKTLVGFGTALAILLGIGAMGILFLRQARSDNQWVEHTHFVIEDLQACLLADREMETYARAFVLTGQNKYLNSYHQAVLNLDHYLEAAQKLTVDNPSQKYRLSDRLRPLIDQRLKISARVMAARQNTGQQAAIAILFQQDLLSIIDDIRHIISEMQQEERGLLRIRITSHEESSHRFQTLIIIGSITAIVFLLIASLLIHQDIRVRQRIENELRESQSLLQQQTDELSVANKELESFSYSVSHDLRTPLRGIEGFSQLLLEQYHDRFDATAKGYFDRISAAARRMGLLIDEILDLSRITRLPLQMQTVDLALLAHSIVEDLQHGSPDRRVSWILPADLPVQGDPTLLHVVLTNLFSNAWKFTSKRKNATIELGTTVMDQKTTYFVRDNGAGFDMAYKNKLFVAFQRLHVSAEFPGIGIGLASVQRAVNRHGGHVWGEGLVDQGATFYFTLS